MNTENPIVCTKCNTKDFVMKREATYLYTYDIDNTNILKSLMNTEETPYTFNNREMVGEDDFLICKNCGERYSYSLDKVNSKIKLTIVQRAIRSDHQDVPEFLGW